MAEDYYVVWRRPTPILPPDGYMDSTPKDPALGDKSSELIPLPSVECTAGPVSRETAEALILELASNDILLGAKVIPESQYSKESGDGFENLDDED